MNHMVFYIEGNIGAGKSTIIQRMYDELKKNTLINVYAYPEPVDIWTGIKHDNKNMLQLLYENPGQYARQFQTLALVSRQAQYTEFMEHCIKSTDKQCIGIFERSYKSDKIFQSILCTQGHISRLDLDIYNTVHIPTIKHIHIYIQLDPEVCLDRIKSRNRPEERTMCLEYLKQLHTLHEEEFNLECDNVIIINNNFVRV